MIEKYHWAEHLCWEIGWAFISLLRGNFSGAREMLFWIKIHLQCSGKKIHEKQSSLVVLRQKAVAIVGLLVLLFGMWLIGYLLRIFGHLMKSV
jgi:hypothetical protein